MNIAVVGASNNSEKYGYRIVRHLLDAGHVVFPVNLQEKIILGQPVYTTLKEIDKPIDIIDIVVPPVVGIDIIKQIPNLGKVHVWLQPGAESKEILEYLSAHASEYGMVTSNQCIMVTLPPA